MFQTVPNRAQCGAWIDWGISLLSAKTNKNSL